VAMHNAARARLVIATAVCCTLRARAQQVRLVLGKTLQLSPELCAPGGRLAQVGKLDLDSTGHVTQCVNDVTAVDGSIAAVQRGVGLLNQRYPELALA
jgi:hypothetical protein